MRKTGKYETLGPVSYFNPYPLPPRDPVLSLDSATMKLFGEAMNYLGRLSEMSTHVPDNRRFIKTYVCKEALLSSAIEGVHTTMLDVFTQPLLDVRRNKNTQLVVNYTHALDVAIGMTRGEGVPLSNRVICALHRALMSEGEGEKSDPGNYRKQSVCVGNLVPPQPRSVPELMSQMERFIHDDYSLPPLIKSGLVHVQFETIHPFLDGNGRVGRLLIVLMLIDGGLLSEPILYPSYYFKKYHLEYYQRLDAVRTHGDFEGWISFYLQVIKESCVDALDRAQDIGRLDRELSVRISQKCTRTRESRLSALALLFSYPVMSIGELARQRGISFNTARQIVSDFVELGILVQETQQARHRFFIFKPYLEILEKEYER
jgi:Fic family protein